MLAVSAVAEGPRFFCVDVNNCACESRPYTNHVAGVSSNFSKYPKVPG